MSHSKSSFFKDVSWDEIVYINRGLNAGDISDILDIVFVPSKLLLEDAVPELAVN